jgi:hypothetical protein
LASQAGQGDQVDGECPPMFFKVQMTLLKITSNSYSNFVANSFTG